MRAGNAPLRKIPDTVAIAPSDRIRVTPPPMKKTPVVPIALTAVAAVAAIGAVAYWIVARNARLALVPAGSETIPQAAIATVSISSDPDEWQQLRQYGTPESQALVDDGLNQLGERLLADNGIDYRRDIAPWVGPEVTVAFFPPPEFEATPDDLPDVEDARSSAAIVLPIEDPQEAQAVLDRPDLETWAKRSYNEIEVWEKGSGDDKQYAAVLGQKFFAIANAAPAIESIIDTYKGEDSLLDIPGYVGTWETFQEEDDPEFVARTFFNIPEAIAVSSENSARPLTPEQLEAVQQQGLATIVRLETEGILFRSISWLKPNSDRRFAVVNAAEGMADRLPQNTVMMMSGGNLQRTWQDYAETARTNPMSPLDPDWLEQALQQTVELDLEADLLSWMRGQFALALVPTPTGVDETFPGGIIFIVKSTDGRKARDVLEKVDEAIAKKYQFQVGEAELQGTSVVKWTTPISGLEIVRGWLEPDLAFFSIGAPIGRTFIPKPEDSFADTEQFIVGVPSLLEPNNGHFFLDVDRTLNSGNFPPLQLPPAQEDILEAIRSIGVTAAVADSRTTRFDILVRLRRTSR